jgi:DNA-binding MarR family transcriptional regulator
MQGKQVQTSLGYALVRAFRTVNRESARALAAHNLSAEQAHILLVLWTEGPMKVGELQRMLSLGSGTLTGAIDRMEKAELVRRAPDPKDGRAFVIEPAPFDAKKKHKIELTLEGIERDCFAMLSARERSELFRLLTKVASADDEG